MTIGGPGLIVFSSVPSIRPFRYFGTHCIKLNLSVGCHFEYQIYYLCAMCVWGVFQTKRFINVFKASLLINPRLYYLLVVESACRVHTRIRHYQP